MNALDLYAKIEPLIGFYDEYEKLYDEYICILKSLHVETILDIGCGNGKFLSRLKNTKFRAKGIDRSSEMIKIATLLGVEADKIELKDIEEQFCCATAIGDVLNYISKTDLRDFFSDLKSVLKKGGYFLADINTLSGFEDVADGLFLKDTEDKFLAIDADFQNTILTTKITLFEKDDKYYKKFSDAILQYYHDIETFQNIEGFELIRSFDISMFGDFDKRILLLHQTIS